jgi:hypothetical protein
VSLDMTVKDRHSRRLLIGPPSPRNRSPQSSARPMVHAGFDSAMYTLIVSWLLWEPHGAQP